MPNSTPVPKRLKEARIRADLSQKALGMAAGLDAFVASPRINQYERGKHTPNFQTLVLLANVLRVPVAYFYADDDVLAQVLSDWEMLDRRGRQEIAKLVRRRAEGDA